MPRLSDAELAAVRSRIQHVFVLMLENRSFDHMFANSGISGIYAATSSDINSYNGTNYPFGGGAPEQMPTDPGHEFPDVVEQLCGEGKKYSAGAYPDINNGGFAANYATTSSEGTPPPPDKICLIMRGIATENQSPTLYKLATEFVLCDSWFSSLPGPTWPNRYFLHGASSAGLDHSPSSEEMAEWETFDGFRYPNGSIFDKLGKNNYRLYQDTSGPELGHIPQVASLKGINVTDVEELSEFAADIANNYNYKYTFIEPSYGDVIHNTYEGGSSQHPMDGIKGGDDLAASVYNTIRNSPLWEKSLFIILYDEHGGFYDHVSPPAAPAPDDSSDDSMNKFGFDFTRYGVRVPAIIISPWVAKGVVSKTQYDHASVLATIEQLFGIEPLTDRDRNAEDLLGLITSNCRTDCSEG